MFQDEFERWSQRHPVRMAVHRIGTDTVAAVVLVVATLVALVWANVGNSYHQVWQAPVSISVVDRDLELSLSEWVNEALMTFFFFGIGLDVRREMSLGDLRRPSAAALPIAAAIGGVLTPALLFLAFNHSGPAAGLWGAVIATDSAFALGMLALIGPGRAFRLRVFLLALSVVDDIGALLVIAVFYTDDLDVIWLGPVLIGLLVVWWLARQGVWRASPYVLVGVGVWLCTYLSGVHATLAGVLLALLLPVYPTNLDHVDKAIRMSHLFRQAPRPKSAMQARQSIDRAVPLNERMSGFLQPYTNYLIVPLFALSNAGVPLSASTMRGALTSSLTWGIIVGLVVGKFVGITGAAALVMKLRPSTVRPGLDLTRIAGVAGLGGMGFTISLLVIHLGIEDERLADEARIGVLLASLLAFLVGLGVFALGNRLKPLPPPSGQTLPHPIDPARDHVRGPVDAPSQLVVYADLGAAYRRRTAEALREVRQGLGDNLCVAYRHNLQDAELLPVALALESAADQGRFWQTHDVLIKRRDLPPTHEFRELADDAGLDVSRLRHDVQTFAHLSRIEGDSADAADAGLDGDPVIFVNGQRLDGPAHSANLLLTLSHSTKGTEPS